MAGWIGLLKHVPWGEVVSNAPKIAEGAKSLWGTVSKRLRPESEVTEAAEAPPAGDDVQPLATRLAALEAQQHELRAQLATSSDLIRSLAEQNTQLVARLDALRRQLRWALFGLVLCGGLAVAALLR